MRTLTWKLGLAFVLVSITGAVVAILFVSIATQQSFQNVAFANAEANFATQMATYYQQNGSWSGVQDAYFASQPNPDQPGQQQRPHFILADQNGMVWIGGHLYQPGDIVPQSDLSKGQAIKLNGKLVGTVLPDGTTPPLSQQDQQYLDSTKQALILGAVVAFLIALGLGIVLARSLTRPVRELTTALQAMAEGELQQAVPVRSKDELGELSAAFNQMSADLAFANQQRRQMTADIAHDLRTPVTVMAGYLEALRDGVLPPSPERFEILYEESQHLQRLIEDLRTLSLADAGELSLQRQPTEPVALLQRIAARYRHQAEQQGIAIEVRAAKDLPEIEVDSERLTQVLSNLVSNALRFTPTDGTITLSVTRAGATVLLRVADTGQGIPPDALPRIFDRFFRVDNARAQSQGESGLGLAIAKAIVEAHGGTISAASPPGQGATFTIRLPG